MTIQFITIENYQIEMNYIFPNTIIINKCILEWKSPSSSRVSRSIPKAGKQISKTKKFPQIKNYFPPLKHFALVHL